MVRERSRREKAPCAGEKCHKDVIAFSDLVQQLGHAKVEVLVHGIELLWLIERDDGDFTAHLEGDGLFWVNRCHIGYEA